MLFAFSGYVARQETDRRQLYSLSDIVLHLGEGHTRSLTTLKNSEHALLQGNQNVCLAIVG